MRKTTVKKMMLGIASTCFLMAGSMMSFAGTWQQTGTGWTYLKDNHQYANNELVADNNQLYYIGADGVMKTGFVPINGVYYYFTPAGNMQTGWVLDNNAWYYMQTDATHFGQMTVNASQNVNGKSYYFGADGKMVNNTTIGQVTYGADGAAVTGQNGNGKAYGGADYLDDNYSSTESGVYAQFGNDDTIYALDKNGKIVKSYSAQDTAYDHDAWVNQIYNLTNNARIKNGQSTLSLDSELCRIADERAEEIADEFQTTSNISHDELHAHASEIRSMFGQIAIRENIDTGAITPTMVMSDWMNSAGHKANILNNNHENIGIGIYQTGYRTFFVQIFTE